MKKPEHTYITIRLLKDSYKAIVKEANKRGIKPSAYARELVEQNRKVD